MNDPLVSVSCTTYNHAPYIRECLDGFLMQKCDFSFEILIHDDASTDNTSNIIREYHNKHPNIIKPIIQTENQWSKGIRPTWKYNIPRAKGKYIALCEGDDYWTDPLKLQKQVDFLENNEDYVLHCTDCLFLDHEKNTVVSSYLQRENCDLQLDSFFRPNNPVSTLTAMFRNTGTIQNHIYDIDIWTALLSRSGTKGYYSNEVTGVYRRHYGGIMSKIGKANALKKMKDIQLRFRNKYPEYKTIIDDTISIYNTRITKELYYFSKYKATCFYFRTFFSNNIKIKDFFYMLRN